MFPSPCSGLVPVASRGFGQTSVRAERQHGTGAFASTRWAPADASAWAAASTSLCARCARLLARLLRTRRHVVSGDRAVMRNAHVLRINRSAQTPRRLCRRRMTCERSPSLWMNAGSVPTGWRPLWVFTRHTAGCWPGHWLPWLAGLALAATGTLNTRLGNPAPNCDAPRVRKNTCVDIQGLACNTSVLHAGFNHHGLRSFPKGSAFFPGCACARRAMAARRGRFMRWDGLKPLALRFGMIFARCPAMFLAGRREEPYKPRSRSSGSCTGSCVFSWSSSASGPRPSLRSSASS